MEFVFNYGITRTYLIFFIQLFGVNIESYFQMLIETVLLSTHSIHFGLEIFKYALFLSGNLFQEIAKMLYERGDVYITSIWRWQWWSARLEIKR